MIRKTTTIIVFSLMFLGCNNKTDNNSSKEIELLKKEIELLKKENKMIQDQKHDTFQNQKPKSQANLLVDKRVTTPQKNKVDRDYLLLNKSVGKFKVGGLIPFPEVSDDYKIKKENQMVMTEEGSVEQPVYIVFKKGKEVMQLIPKYDIIIEKYTQEIGKIIVTSPLVKTIEGIGVGSTIEEFISNYPNYKLWYTYVSGMYVLEANNIDGQFILNEKDFIGKLNINSDMITFKKSDLKKGARIIKVSIW